MIGEKFNFFGQDERLKKAMKRFFLSLVALIILWQLLYNFVLKPLGEPDKFLTTTVASGAVVCINAFVPVTTPVIMGSYYEGAGGLQLLQNNKVVFVIGDICNGLDLIVIYWGLIFILPFYSFKRKMVFGISGAIAILLANVIRVTLLYWLYFYHRPMFELNHKYIFTLLLYLMIFYGWILFTRKGLANGKE